MVGTRIMLQHCLCLSWLWSLLTAGLASSTLNAITPQAVEASAQDRAPAFDYSRQQQTLPLAQRAPLTPTRTSKENEALVGPNRRSSTVGLDRSSVASLPRAGAIGNRKGKVNGMLDRVRNKRNELPSPGSELQKAVAVNAASWAAVVGGVVLWSRTKMGSEEGNDMFAAAAWSPALSGTAAAVVHIVPVGLPKELSHTCFPQCIRPPPIGRSTQSNIGCPKRVASKAIKA